MIKEINSNQIYTPEDNIIWENKTKRINPITKLEVSFMIYNKEIYYPTSERITKRVN